MIVGDTIEDRAVVLGKYRDSRYSVQRIDGVDAVALALDAGELPLLRGYGMTDEDQIRYHAIMHIMCNLYIDYARLSNEMDIDFAKHFKADIASLDDLEADGLVRREANGLHVTPLGRLFIRIVAMRFDAYLQDGKRKGQYSQTV